MEGKSAYEDVVADNIKTEMVEEYVRYLKENKDATLKDISELIVEAVEKYCPGQPVDIMNLIKIWSTGFFAGAIYMKYYDNEDIVTT